jgi:hypothetical protein
MRKAFRTQGVGPRYRSLKEAEDPLSQAYSLILVDAVTIPSAVADVKRRPPAETVRKGFV